MQARGSHERSLRPPAAFRLTSLERRPVKVSHVRALSSSALLPAWAFPTGLISLGILYIGIVLSNYYEGLRGDEIGYVSMAADFARGKGPEVMWWGPGYPLVLAPFIRFGIPMYWANLLNVVFMLGTLNYVHLALKLYLPPRWACAICLGFGMYPPFWFYASMLLSEKLAIFLMSGFIYFYLKSHVSSHAKTGTLIVASVQLGFLALTKVFYGYVILTAICLTLVLRLTRTPKLQPTLFMLSLAMLGCLPWLSYTYRQSGHLFYWATSGGSSLYWMSTPFPGESGTWFRPQDVDSVKELRTNHYAFFHSTANLSVVQRDEMFKRQAIQNIIAHPTKFASNCLVNVSRLLFDCPYDYFAQPVDSLRRLAIGIPNFFLIVLLLLSLARLRSPPPYELLCVLVFGFMAFAGSIPLSAYNRMFTVLVPILVVWISCSLIRHERISEPNPCRLPVNSPVAGTVSPR